MKFRLPKIVFETTPRCNLSCQYCYNIWKRPGAESVPIPDYRQARRTLKRLFSQAAVEHVTVSGGEPFLSDRLAEIVLFCLHRKKSVSIISNGTVGTEEDYRQLIDLGVGLFQFPYYSSDSRCVAEAVGLLRNNWDLPFVKRTR